MNKPITVDRIVVKIHGKELALTPSEANELHEVLASLLGKRHVVIERIPLPYYPQPIAPWLQPVWCGNKTVANFPLDLTPEVRCLEAYRS